MEIPNFLKTEICSGNVVLMLGAGASIGATAPNGSTSPSGKELTNLLSDRFLDSKFKELPLNQVSELAIDQSDPVTVQEFIREILEPFEPTESHFLLTGFYWHGIATTNYDLLVEKTYDLRKNIARQKVVPVIDNNDRIDQKLRTQDSIRYLKLHGCITRTNNIEAPLILTTEQYVEYKNGRKRVFEQFNDWLYEHIVVFLGYRLQDPDLRAILLEINNEIKSRQKFYLVAPDVSEEYKRFWEKRNITVLTGTFNDFLHELDESIETPLELIPRKRTKGDLPISEKFIQSEWKLNDNTLQFLEEDVDYVKPVMSSGIYQAKDFYKGLDLGWDPIINEWDVRRGLVDSILANNIIDKRDNVEETKYFYLIKASAGAGKKTLLRRLAYDAAVDYNCLCLYLKKYGQLNSAAIQDISRLTNERIFLYIEDAPERVVELLGFFKSVEGLKIPITIISTARTNEWNVSCLKLSEYVTNEYNLRYLSHKDIDNLLSLLEKHKSLGTLEKLEINDRRAALEEKADRQILVALHEATQGKPFEEILQNEYKNIKPIEAQRIYLTISIMNRFNIPVRAGIISRIHNISFQDFRKRLFAPLELIVSTEYNHKIKEYFYKARHSHIAEIIYENILSNQEERFNEFVKCLKCLNISYQTDRKVFYKMIRANQLMEEFSDHNMISQIYNEALELVGEHKELLHQMAIYEMKRVNGNLREANKLLEKANEKAPNDYTIIHSFAELKLHLAENTHTELEQKFYLNQAKHICIENSRNLDSYGIATLIKSELLRLEQILSAETITPSDEHEIQEIVKVVDKYLENGLQRYPGSHHLLNIEARLAKLISDYKRLVDALSKSFHINPRNSYVALWLSKCYQENGDYDKAKTILEQGLEAKSSKELHYAYAKLLLGIPDYDKDTLLYHLKKSYTLGDNNYDAQLLHARQLYISGNIEDFRKIFRFLKNAKVGFEQKIKPLHTLPEEYHGAINLVEASYCFIKRDGIGDYIYFHQDNDINHIFENIALNDRVVFRISFNMYGSVATDIKLERDISK